MDSAVELAVLIAGLRRELTQAMVEGAGSLVRFTPGPVELELTVAIERATDPHVGVRFWVIDAGADIKRSNTVTQRIKVQLHPQRVAGDGDNGTSEPWISGSPLPGER